VEREELKTIEREEAEPGWKTPRNAKEFQYG